MPPQGEVYEIGSTYQPHELPLPLQLDELFRLDDLLTAAGAEPRETSGDKFIIMPVVDT